MVASRSHSAAASASRARAHGSSSTRSTSRPASGGRPGHASPRPLPGGSNPRRQTTSRPPDRASGSMPTGRVVLARPRLLAEHGLEAVRRPPVESARGRLLTRPSFPIGVRSTRTSSGRSVGGVGDVRAVVEPATPTAEPSAVGPRTAPVDEVRPAVGGREPGTSPATNARIRFRTRPSAPTTRPAAPSRVVPDGRPTGRSSRLTGARRSPRRVSRRANQLPPESPAASSRTANTVRSPRRRCLWKVGPEIPIAAASSSPVLCLGHS